MTDHSNRGYDLFQDLIDSGQIAIDETVPTFRFVDPTKKLHLKGSGNYGPRQVFADHLFEMDDETFVKQAEQSIWLAAYAANNPISDYHWQVDACYQEALRRDNPKLYERAWHNASGM